MRSKEGHGIVAPVIAESGGSGLGVELEDGQEFDRCDAQSLKVRNLVDDSEIRTPVGGSNAGVRMACKSRYMYFVDYGPAE